MSKDISATDLSRLLKHSFNSPFQFLCLKASQQQICQGFSSTASTVLSSFFLKRHLSNRFVKVSQAQLQQSFPVFVSKGISATDLSRLLKHSFNSPFQFLVSKGISATDLSRLLNNSFNSPFQVFVSKGISATLVSRLLKHSFNSPYMDESQTNAAGDSTDGANSLEMNDATCEQSSDQGQSRPRRW